jgi:hypothetical protein
MSFQVRNDAPLAFTAGTAVASANIDCTVIDRMSLQAEYTAVTQSAAAFASSSAINDTTMIFTKTAHGLVTGTVGQFTTSSALPTGLSTSTNYWVIYVDANDVQFATSLANAQAGTFLSITSTGTGTQTFTPTSLSGVLKVSTSNDSVSPTNWTDIPGTTVTITGTGSTYWSSLTTYISSSVTYPQLDVSAKWMRILFTPTSGALTLSVAVNASSLTRN